MSSSFQMNILRRLREKYEGGAKKYIEQPSYAKFTVDIQHVIMSLLNDSTISPKEKLDLLPKLIKQLIAEQKDDIINQEKLPKHEILISLKEIKTGVRSILDQTQKDGFIPTHIIGIANGGYNVAYYFAKHFKIAPGVIGYKSYTEQNSGEIQETTSSIFPLDFSSLSKSGIDVKNIKILIIDDLTETGQTMKEAIKKISQELKKYGLTDEEIKPIIKTAVLFVKGDYHTDYTYKTLPGNKWVRFLRER